MKKTLLIILLFLSFIGADAQSAYIPFTNNMIVYGASNLDDMSGLHPPVFFRTEITGDTLIAGLHYSKIYDGIGPFVFSGGIRNDIFNKKVYRYYPSLGTEKLLYDFDLSIGDTVNSSAGYGFYSPLINFSVAPSFPSIDKAWVSSIDSVLMPHDSLYHKRFNFKAKIIGSDSILNSETASIIFDSLDNSQGVLFHSLIEGVGQMDNAMDSYSQGNLSYAFNWFAGPICSSINGIYIAHNLGPTGTNPALAMCNSIYAGIDELQTEEVFTIYPNPTNGVFQIKSEKEINLLEITDVLGKIIYRSEIKNKITEVDLSYKKSGIYFIRLIDMKGNCVVKKIIKQ